ncbi:MAG: diguanylate cyclase [Gemmatimonadales bacterium]|nr:MAG: diguanylate cyclase [Gemmatimonadales bacterium]
MIPSPSRSGVRKATSGSGTGGHPASIRATPDGTKMAKGLEGKTREGRPVPLKALGLSLLALTAPVVGALAAPEWMEQESGVLLWLTALIPPFLLTYYRGWRGASLGLAGGMAALSIAHALTVILDMGQPDFRVLFWMVSTYLVVCVGIGVLAEVLRRERAAAESMALTDPLTQIPNRRHASIFLDAAFAAAVRGEPLSVVLMDLDRFKAVNDTHGHKAGDEVLMAFASALTRVTRRMDLSCRWGGEEFLTVLYNCDAEGAKIFLGRLRDAFREEEIPVPPVTFSAGIAQYASGMGSVDVMIAAADQALYEAKEAGRNRWEVASPPQVEVDVGLEEEAVGGPDPLGEVSTRLRAGADEQGLAFDPDSEVSRPVGFEGARARDEGAERILVVDDDPETRRGMARVLRRLGYEVLEAPDGPSGLATARSLPRVDLVVTDLVMPGMSGFRFVSRLEAERGPVRVLYVTGHSSGGVGWSAAPGACSAYLSKPLEVEDLASRVRELLDQSLPPVPSTPL